MTTREGGFLFIEGDRGRRDQANRSNLLLLLSRGYWSTEFLQAVTREFYAFERREGENAWPAADSRQAAAYAPSPDGVHLTDGVLALTAALTANSTASAWAFSDFLPGTTKVEGSEYSVGKFTHFLMFEHQFGAGTNLEGVGATSVLTALSSAIDHEGAGGGAPHPAVDRGPLGAVSSVFGKAITADPGPLRDTEVLRALATRLAKESGCSRNPLTYGDCVVEAAKSVWGWVVSWGHVVLDILTLATFAPPPFAWFAATAAATNATWFAIEGDYKAAGLSLQAVRPGKATAKVAGRIAQAVKRGGARGGTGTVVTTEKPTSVAPVASQWRPMPPWRDCDLLPPGGLRLAYGATWTPEQRSAAEVKVREYLQAAQRGELKKTRPSTASRSRPLSEYKRAGGTLNPGEDLDHVIDRELGGSDDLSNLRPLDTHVNRSLDKQVAAQIRHLDEGALILGAAIC